MIKTSCDQVKDLFNNLGVPRGGVVMLHTSLFALGKLEGGTEGFYNALWDHLGEDATIVVPTFTYSFRRQEIFDVRHSPSAKSLGIFPEYVRCKFETVRSGDPLFSMAAIGPMAKELMVRESNACFGPGSIYGKLFHAGALFVGIGITYSTGFAGFMHLEKLANVFYRQDVEFHGLSIDHQSKKFGDYAIHYARNEEVYRHASTNRESIGRILEERGASKAITYGYGTHHGLSGPLWSDIVLEELATNPSCMLDPR